MQSTHLKRMLKFFPRATCLMDLLLLMASTRVTMSESKPAERRVVTATVVYGLSHGEGGDAAPRLVVQQVQAMTSERGVGSKVR